MVRNKLDHCLLGLTIGGLALAVNLCFQIPSYLKLFLWVIAVAGFAWAYVVGHAWMVIPMFMFVTFFLLAYFVVPPVKLKRGRAFERDAEILAYCVRPDRIVVVRELPTLGSTEGHSLFLPKRMYGITKRRLAASDALELPIDEDAAAIVYGRALPDLSEIDSKHTDRSVIENIHGLLRDLWGEHKNSPMRENVLHLALWYAIAADKYFRHAERSWLDHALL
jgi:hypothetical protein